MGNVILRLVITTGLMVTGILMGKGIIPIQFHFMTGFIVTFIACGLIDVYVKLENK